MIKGSCLCGQVRYELDGGIQLINNCHCSMCRKAHGSAFGTFLHAHLRGFRWLSGEDTISHYCSSAGNDRAFCSACGSSMPVVNEEEGEVNIPAGSLDDDPGIKPVVHIFTAHKAPWHEITDDIQQFDEFPPDEWIDNAINQSTLGD
jgi:hypothetical protein